MKLLKLAFRRQTAVPMLALTFTSVVTIGLVAARIIWTRDLIYASLVWNLFLAWVPLGFALLAGEAFQEGKSGNWRFLGFALAWLLFFPNAPYIFTDVVHLTTYFYSHFWVDLMLILLCALTGLVVGFVSLFLMQGVVRGLFGTLASWVFIGAVAGLSGFGIYLGRFQRFNSWDIIWKPMALSRGIGKWASNPLSHSNTFAFPMLFAVFLFLAYLMLYALTRLEHAHTPNRQVRGVFTPNGPMESAAA
ncbi:MAG TPA: DUF1361 domain-containing protein [Verrucomicrobiae bacterium]|nr:DUF1361 domain-containing protein [Verrucomicrobiae bacterium]